jgi:hypothetical protein
VEAWRHTDSYIITCRNIKQQGLGLCIDEIQEGKRADVIVATLKEFKDEVGFIRGLEGDNEFSSAAIKKFCEDNNIRLETSVAKEEHISNGNKLGIIDRLVRTLRELMKNILI